MRLIDADALEKAISISHSMTDDYGIKTGYEISMRLVEEQPTIEPERKAGRWIEMSSTNHTYKCSVCGRLLANITDGKNNVAKNYPYCHCGADMRGEQDDT